MARGLLVAVALALAVVLGVAPIAPVAPIPASAPATEFSAERAMRALQVIAAKPHPTGSPADDEVREYLTRELEALGFVVDVQDTTALSEVYAARFGIPVVAAHVRNLVALRRGREEGPGLLLMAHYDSRELAPGASDDGYGAAALLETARALSASPPLRHDVRLLFTEGEEQGMLGAKAFLDESPLRPQVALALNFEARGDRGPVLMFQASDRAGALIDVLASSAPHVAASSLSQEIYRRMPNDTDLTLFLRQGVPAMNFANIEGVARYHEPTDTVANADAATLQHHGSYALSLTRAFADAPALPPPPRDDEVYFTAGTLFVHYAAREAPTLAGLAVGLLAIALGVGVRRRRLKLGGVLAGTALALLSVVVAALVGEAAWWAASQASHGALGMQTAREDANRACVAAMVLLGGAIPWAFVAAARPRLRTDTLALGALLVWGALAAATALRMPGASYLFLWPTLAASAAWCLRIAVRSLDGTHPAAIAAHLIAAMAAIILLVPVALQLGVAFGPGAAPALAALGALAATASVPAMKSFGNERRWIAPTLMVVVAVAVVAGAAFVPPFDAGSPRPDSLLYAADADRGAASWISTDETPDGWTGKVLGGATRGAVPGFFPREHLRFLQAPAPTIPLDAPRIGILADTREGASRTLRLRVTFPVSTEAVELAVPPEAHVTAASVQGRPFGTEPSDGWLDLVFFGPPPSGLELALETLSTGAVPLHVLTQSRGLPPSLLAPLGPRPSDRMPEVVQWNALGASDMTLLTTSFDL